MGLKELASSLLTCAMLLGAPVLFNCHVSKSSKCLRLGLSDTSIYNFTVPDLIEARNVSLSEYQDKVTLIVNVATYCDFTWHYLQLNELKSQFKDDLEILAFPCNQFNKLEPGGNAQEILNGIKHVRPGNGFEPNFPLFKKIDVNGEKEDPLYHFLKTLCPATREEFYPKEKLFYTPMKNNDIRWNFEKILVDKSGMPVLRLDPSVEPERIKQNIYYLLRE